MQVDAEATEVRHAERRVGDAALLIRTARVGPQRRHDGSRDLVAVERAVVERVTTTPSMRSEAARGDEQQVARALLDDLIEPLAQAVQLLGIAGWLVRTDAAAGAAFSSVTSASRSSGSLRRSSAGTRVMRSSRASSGSLRNRASGAT